MKQNPARQPSKPRKPDGKEGKSGPHPHSGSAHTTRQQQEHAGTGWRVAEETVAEKPDDPDK